MTPSQLQLLKLLQSDKFTEAQLRSAVLLLRSAAAGEISEKRLALITRIGRRGGYVEDLFGTMATASWLNETRFVAAYEAARAASVWTQDIRWRIYTLMVAADHGRRIEGNFVECGVDRGGTATAVLNYNGEDSFINRKFFLFDTFEGLVAEQMSDGEAQRDHFSSDRYPSVYEDVKQRFSSLPFVLPIKGAVPDSLAAYDGGPVAYLHIDMNVALPECAAFEFFWPLLTKGAPVIFDDYGFPLHTEQREALDITAKKLGTTIMMLPTGQGLTWR